MKKRERIILIGFVFLAFWGFSEAYLSIKGDSIPDITTSHPAIAAVVEDSVPSNNSLSLITEPNDGMTPVVSFIKNAQKSVDLIIYTLNDKEISGALISAKNRGVSVRVILNAGWEGVHSKTNQKTFDYLSSNGIAIKWSPEYFALMHQKTLIIDGNKALISTFNYDKTYYKKDREFGIVDTDPTDVSAILESFNSDWNSENKISSDGRDLVWSPGSEDILVALIASAKKSLRIYCLEMDEPAIEDALQSASRRGVDVEVLMSMQTSWLTAFRALTASGVKIRTYDSKAPIYIHAKVILVDDTRAFVGSENSSVSSLENNRELGIIFSKPDIISSILNTFKADWPGAVPFQ